MERLWEAQLSVDPVAWIRGRLEDLSGTLAAAGVPELAAIVDNAAFRPYVAVGTPFRKSSGAGAHAREYKKKRQG
jgi:hypothetical protein